MVKINLSNLRGDFTGGLTAGIVALPLALALGVASGLGPMAGLVRCYCGWLLCRTFRWYTSTDFWSNGAYGCCSCRLVRKSVRRRQPYIHSCDIGRYIPDCFWCPWCWPIHSPGALPGNIGLYVGHRCNHHHSSNRPLTGP